MPGLGLDSASCSLRKAHTFHTLHGTCRGFIIGQWLVSVTPPTLSGSFLRTGQEVWCAEELILSGPRPHLAGGSLTHHGLIRWGQLSGIQHAGAVDGNIVYSAEWGGGEVQVEAPRKQDSPSHGHPLRAQSLTFLFKC